MVHISSAWVAASLSLLSTVISPFLSCLEVVGFAVSGAVDVVTSKYIWVDPNSPLAKSWCFFPLLWASTCLNPELLAVIMTPSLISHWDIYRGGLHFRRISTVAQKYFDALPWFFHDIHATLSVNCKYISFNPNIPCFNVKLTNSMQNFTFC